MSDIQLLDVSHTDDGVAIVRLQNGKVNSFSMAMLDAIYEIGQKFIAEPPKAVIFFGNDRLFAAGADISEFNGPEEAKIIGEKFLRAMNAVSQIPRVTIAAVHGFALGGGCELTLACDFRIAASNAVFGQPEVLLGIIPGGGGTQRLTRLVGSTRAKDLILSGRQVRAEEALRIGLVEAVVDTPELLDYSIAFATKYAKGAVLAQGLIKKLIDDGLSMDLSDGLLFEQEYFSDVFATKDAQTGIQSFLTEGPGKATFHGE